MPSAVARAGANPVAGACAREQEVTGDGTKKRMTNCEAVVRSRDHAVGCAECPNLTGSRQLGVPMGWHTYPSTSTLPRQISAKAIRVGQKALDILHRVLQADNHRPKCRDGLLAQETKEDHHVHCVPRDPR